MSDAIENADDGGRGNEGSGNDGSGNDRSEDPDGDTAAPTDHRPTCPYCGSTGVTLESVFGSEISKSQYYCGDCRTMFERLKYDGRRPDTGR